MAYRRTLFLLTVLSALLLFGSLGLVVHTRSERNDLPARIELSRSLMSILAQLNDRVEALVAVQDLSGLRQARQDLAQAVLAFDQDLLASGETVRDEHARQAIIAIQTIWRDLGLALADLAAGEYAANSAAGERTVALMRSESPAMRHHLETVITALHGADQKTGKLSGLAATGMAILGVLTLLLGAATSRSTRASFAKPETSKATTCAPQTRNTTQAAELGAGSGSDPYAVAATEQSANFSPARPAGPFTAHGDLGLASAAVDRVALDMGTVARSTERMQQAVDSVASALHGMLFSLNEMAQDTFEGSQLTRSAHNAAIYAAETARELLESAREMGAVVARVRTLAARSQEIAGRIEADAAATGATGEAFTSVVAQEVRQLATATANASSHIEATVDEVIAGQRQYEEAIGQIIRNIGAVRKVAASMGALMLAPPLRVQPGVGYPKAEAGAAPTVTPHAFGHVVTQTPATPTGQSAAESAPYEGAAAASTPAEPAADLDELPAPSAAPLTDDPSLTLQDDVEPFALDPAETLQKADELVAATSNLLDELAEVAAEAGDQPPQPTVPELETPEKPVEQEKAAEPTAADSVEKKGPAKKPAEPSGSNGNVFMLKGLKNKATEVKPAPEAAPEPAPAKVQTAPDDPANVEELETVGAAAGPAKPRTVAQGASGNIFMLNKPKK